MRDVGLWRSAVVSFVTTLGRFRALVLWLFLTVVPQQTFAVDWLQGYWDPRNELLTVNGYVRVIAAHDTNVYIGDEFTSVGGVAATNIARFDGTRWYPLGEGLSGKSGFLRVFGPVQAIAVSGDCIYAGGCFTNSRGQLLNRVARWDGTNWSPLGDGLNDTCQALVVLGTNLYAGGHFTNAGGTAAEWVARWDGTSWWPMGRLPSVTNPPATTVGDLESFEGVLYAATWSSVARWDGTNWSNLGSNTFEFNPTLKLDIAVGAAGVFAAGSRKSTLRWNGVQWNEFAVQCCIIDFSPIIQFNAVQFVGSVVVLGGNDLCLRYPVGAWNCDDDGPLHQFNGVEFSSMRLGGRYVTAMASNGRDLFVAYSPWQGTNRMLGIFHPPPPNWPLLTMRRTTNQVVLSWPVTAADFSLETSSSLNGSNWQWAVGWRAVLGDNYWFTNEFTNGSHFYRLRSNH